MTLGEVFAKSARKFPDRIAVGDPDRRLTYAVLNERVNRLANGLAGLGLRRGDRVATLSRNTTFLAESYLASLKLGLVNAPIVARATVEDYKGQLELSDPRALLFHSEYQEQVAALREFLPADIILACFGENPPSFARDYEELLRKASPAEVAGGVSEDDEAFLMFTGGTTGKSKGALLTHKNLLWNSLNFMIEAGFPQPGHVTVYPMQLYHVAGASRFLSYMHAGATFLLSPDFDPERFLRDIERERTNFALGNTAIWRMMLDAQRAGKHDTSSVKYILHGHSFLTPALRAELEQELFLNGQAYVLYALTESSPGVALLKPGDDPLHYSSLGRPFLSLDVRIGDPLSDQALPQGEVGQILVSGPTVTKGYFRNPESSREALKGGWLHTGDLGYYDERGYLYMSDRLKDMIKTGGINVYSAEVEDIIAQHPGVLEAAVIGVHHEKWGETIRAVVVPRPGAQVSEKEIIQHCTARLASHKKPTSVVFVESLPKGSFGGKILKNKLRELYGKA
ncbi:MAG: AMP-binding protein [Thermodesulfobacteriota bacterium]